MLSFDESCLLIKVVNVVPQSHLFFTKKLIFFDVSAVAMFFSENKKKQKKGEKKDEKGGNEQKKGKVQSDGKDYRNDYSKQLTVRTFVIHMSLMYIYIFPT